MCATSETRKSSLEIDELELDGALLHSQYHASACTYTRAKCHAGRPLSRGGRRRLVHWLHFPSRCVHVRTYSHGAVTDGSLARSRARARASERPRRSYACIGYARIAACVRLLTYIRQGAKTPRCYDSYTPDPSRVYAYVCVYMCVCVARCAHACLAEMRFALTCARAFLYRRTHTRPRS